ncbi:MAG: RagB/SusD family nutrient uptake outer membrane protein, partial [Dysgonamonadaceae bacterium]|nr:RagB/SusD family nutrient uptake outer membrane protein [Dysgonamonadaceae bacterium]
ILANLYSKPYVSLREKALPTDLCVPVKENSTPTTEAYGRATIAEVWNIITSDIQTALVNLKGKSTAGNRYEISYQAALALAIRIALYMEDWDRVIALGEEFRRDFASIGLYDISGKTTAGLIVNLDGIVIPKFMNTQNTELIWTFGSRHYHGFNSILLPSTIKNDIVRYLRVSTHSNDINTCLLDMYESGDRRKNYWFFEPVSTETVNPSLRYNYVTCKFDNKSTEHILYTCFAFRTAEVYLNLAEAYARKSNREPDKVFELLNALRKKRFDPAVYADLSPADYATPEALRQLVWDERRRELCFEELHRWWDLRRTTQPRIKHLWRNNTHYILEEGDPAYVLNFPDAELAFAGSVLVPNARPNRSPIND